MSLLNRLYETYNRCLENELVDNCKEIDSETVLLPLFHTNKRSNGNDIIEITINEDSEFIDAQYLPKDSWLIFPITEDSLTRSSGPAPHPLCDSFKYLSKLDEKNHQDYLGVLEGWYEYSINNNPCRELLIIRNYMNKSSVMENIMSSIYHGKNPVLEKYKLTYYEEKNGKEDKIVVDLEKTFITFKLELEKTITVTKCVKLHQNYEAYQREMLKNKEQSICDISNKLQYCTSKHRSLLGTSKMIGTSNNKWTYYGRFKDGNEVICIGYETSQKIHNMLKYLMDNPKTNRFIGENSYLINWFSDDIGNEENLNILDEYDINTSTKIASNFVLGESNQLCENNQYYVLILDKISNGRISVKYFRELSKSDLYERVTYWYQTMSWSAYSYEVKGFIEKAFPLYRLTELTYGTENSGKMICNSKLKKSTIERLLHCIIDQKPFPRDIKRKMVENASHRMSYKNNWNNILSAACAVIKKCNADYGNPNHKEVSIMLDKQNLDRSYLYGRLLAVAEKVERDTYGDNESRLTNAERLWSVFTRRPATTWMLLEEKLMPYYGKLSKTKKGGYYKKLVSEIMNELEPMADNNKKLNENFVLGYYHQRKDFYTKKEIQTNEEECTDELIKQKN